MNLNNYETSAISSKPYSKSDLMAAAFKEYNEDAMVNARPVLDWNSDENIDTVVIWQRTKNRMHLDNYPAKF